MKKSLLPLFIWFVGVSAFGQCVPTFTVACTSDDFIDNVTFNTISNLGTGCSNPSASNYSDYTAMSTNVMQGVDYPISVTPGASWGEFIGVWIDFNQNNVFDTNEFFDLGYAPAGTAVGVNITIPSGIPAGATKMRVLCRYLLALTPGDACNSNLNAGECEDYTVIIAPPAPNDASVASIDAPSTGCGLGLETVTATFSNNGSNVITDIDVCYRINGGAWICDALSGLSIASFTNYQYSFSTLSDLSIPGDYFIDFAVSLAGDSISTNDTILGQYVISKPIISSFPYVEKFENGSGGWHSLNGPTGTWELGTPAGTTIIGAASGQNAWITNASGNYGLNDNSSVVSPCFDFTNLLSGSSIAMKIWWNSEVSFDGANLQYSLNDGITWSIIGLNGDPYNWFNDNVASSPGGFTQGWSGWDANQTGSSGWVIASHSLDDAIFMGQTSVLFRVSFASDGTIEDDGFAFDDIVIAVPPAVDLGPDYADCTSDYEIDLGEAGDYQWYIQDLVTMTSTPYSDSSVVVFTNPTMGNTSYNGILVLTDSLGLSTADTILMTFTVPPSNVLADVSNCYNDTMIYTVGSNPNYVYDWNNGATTSSAEYIGGGPVQVIVTDTVSACADTAAAMIYQMPPVSVSVLDTMVCSGDSVTLDVADIYDSYLWSTADSTNSITVTASGLYTISVTDSIGCLSQDSSLVVVNLLPAPIISGLPDTMCVYSDVVATSDPVYLSYLWSTGGITDSEFISGNTFGLGAHVITLAVEDTNGCLGSSDYTLFIDGCAGLEELALFLSIYPNPSTGVFHFEVEGELNGAEITVMDMLGKTIWRKELTETNGIIDLSRYENGTYLLKIVQSKSSNTIRLIKQ